MKHWLVEFYSISNRKSVRAFFPNHLLSSAHKRMGSAPDCLEIKKIEVAVLQEAFTLLPQMEKWFSLLRLVS